MKKFNSPSKTFSFSKLIILLVMSGLLFSKCGSSKVISESKSNLVESLNPIYYLNSEILNVTVLDSSLTDHEKNELIAERMKKTEKRIMVHDSSRIAVVLFDVDGKVKSHMLYDQLSNLYKTYEVNPFFGTSYNVVNPDEEFPPEAEDLILQKIKDDGMMVIDRTNIKNIHGYSSYSIIMNSPEGDHGELWVSDDFPKAKEGLIADLMHFQHMIFLNATVTEGNLQIGTGVTSKVVDASMAKYLVLDESTYKLD